MDAAALEGLLAPFAPVAVKRMFGGATVYADGLGFAIEAGAKAPVIGIYAYRGSC